MGITLRTDIGTALTHTQVDSNFCSLFFSASVNNQTLTLYTTGSSGLGTPIRSSSLTLTGLNYWTASGGNLTTNSGTIITGSLVNGYPGLISTANYTHVEGKGTLTSAELAHAEGNNTVANGYASHTEGIQTITAATGSHAEGFGTQALGEYSHTEGFGAISTGECSHAEGNTSTSVGDYSHAEGEGTTTFGIGSHAEGSLTIASGDYSHAEGTDTQAIGTGSHAEGISTVAEGNWSHTEGIGTHTQGSYQTVVGSYNVLSSFPSAFIVGNGTGTLNRSNLLFASGSTFQVTGSSTVTGSQTLIGPTPVYFGTRFTQQTSSYAIFRDRQDRLTIGNNVIEGHGSDGIKIDTSGKVQINHISQNYSLYDTSLNIVGSGSNDGITFTQWPDISNRYRITVQSGSTTSFNFSNSLHPTSGSYNFSGSVNITDNLIVSGNRQFNHGMFYHTASISVGNGISGSTPLSTTAVANGVLITSESRITVINPGYYNIQFSGQLTQGASTGNFYIWFKKNGSNIANSMSKKTLTSNTNQIMTVDINDYASNAGDYYEIVHQSDANTSTLEYIPASGNYPASPPMIVTVKQIG